ncbi:MAG: ECF transporter S component [Lachnospiraceae bacterium]|nr:ECF transporter S component [Lachnospiraceae bacterium]
MNSKTSNQLTRQIAITAILLAVCIVSQFFKSLSVYITGPVVNLCLILAVMTAGLTWGLILAVITPVTAFIIAASPVMSAVPGIIPLIMLGNAVLVLMVHFFFKPAVSGEGSFINVRSGLMAVLSSLAKGCIMGLTIALWLLPAFIPQESPLRGKMSVFQTTFSVTQFVTALIGFVYFFIVWKPVQKIITKQDAD